MIDTNFYALDIETESLDKANPQYALEPQRVRQKLAKISSVAVSGPNGALDQYVGLDSPSGKQQFREVLDSLAGKKVFAHYAVFDTAWLYLYYGWETLNCIKWLDTATLAKWILNSQRIRYKSDDEASEDGAEVSNFQLKSLVARYCNHPLKAKYLSVKDDSRVAGEDQDYWLFRGKLDAFFTRDLAIQLLQIMPAEQFRGYELEQRGIMSVARSWVTGLNINPKGAADISSKCDKAMAAMSKHIGIGQEVINSPKQLGDFLFTTNRIVPNVKLEKTGAPSVSKDNLLLLAVDYAGTNEGKLIKDVLDFKQVSTLKSKFLNSMVNVAKYNGCDNSFSSPRMFSTYTGRFTYASKVLKKWPVGIATHQLPRKGPVRGLLEAPNGFLIGELDANAQEMRGMGQTSRDQRILSEFNNGIDLHSSMAANLARMAYEEFVKIHSQGDEYCKNYRMAGKLLNLSCQYRIGAKALRMKFFTTYGITISLQLAYQYLSAYKKRYPGVVAYWKSAVEKAIQCGYAETIAGRRYYIDRWSDLRWACESSAINFPVQGFGAEHKCVAIAELADNFPEAIFILDLHDGLYNLLPETNGHELLLDMRSHLNKLNYSDIWDKETALSFPFDGKIGKSFGSLKSI